MKRAMPWLMLAIGWMAVSCAPLNQRLEHYDREAGYRFGNLAKENNSDEVFIVLSLSGGGTRAAALGSIVARLADDRVLFLEVQFPIAPLDPKDLLTHIHNDPLTVGLLLLPKKEISLVHTVDARKCRDHTARQSCRRRRAWWRHIRRT